MRTDSRVSVERLASVVRPMGTIESRERGTGIFLIQLRPGIDDDGAKERLAKIPGIHPLAPRDEPVDRTSVRSLDRKIAHLSNDELEERREGKNKEAEHEKDLVDYLKAYRYFISRRAYPHDSVNWGAFAKGRAHAAAMTPTVLKKASSTGHSDTSSQQWTFVGPTNLAVPYEQYYGIGPVNGRVNAVAYDPDNSQIIYAGGAQGGLWMSSNSGSTWTWLSSTWSMIAVNCIVVDPSNTDTIYVGLGDYHGEIAGSYGIMKTTDGGNTWTNIATSAMGNIGVAAILMDPTNDQVLIAGTGDVNSYGNLWRSTNGGQTWTKLSAGGNNFLWPTLASSEPVGSTVRFYAVAGGIANSNGATSRVYKSDDHGVTWQLISSPLPTDGNFHWAFSVATSPTASGNVYVFDSEDQILCTSANQGASWTNQSSNLPTGSQDYNFSQSFYDWHLECGSRVVGSTNSDILYLGEIDLAESTNQGASWTSVGGPSYAASGAIIHNDQHCLAIYPSNPNQCIFSNDGGVYSMTYDAGTGKNTITPLNEDLGVTMFYKIALHPTNADYILGGTQDNASPLCTGNLSSWLNEGGGDGGGSAINQTNPEIQFTSSEDLNILETPNAWSVENNISPSTGASENLPFVCAMTLAPLNQNLMYTASNYLYQWNETSRSWMNRLGNQDLTEQTSTSPTVDAIAIAPGDLSRIYTGSSDGALYMSTNTGTTWTLLSGKGGSLPAAAVTSISVSASNENDILIGIGGAGDGNPHIYRCTNTTAATPVFTSVSGSSTSALPDVSLNAIARDLDNPSTTWWVAMDVGVFETTNSGATWTNAGAAYGLPNVIVDDLVAVPGTRYLNAGTYGRGMWRLLLPESTAALSTLTLSSTSVRAGTTVTGTVTLTSEAPTGGAVISLTSSNPALATVPASITIPAGSTTATFTVTTLSATAAGTSTVTAGYLGVQQSQVLSVTVPTISGTITFGSYVGTPPATVTMYFRLAGATSPFTSMSVAVASNGTYTASGVPAEAYTVYIQPGSWLRSSLSLNLTSGNATGANFSLINGDVNGDNRVNSGDVQLIQRAMGSKPGSANWNAKADLNGDGQVTSADLAIAYANNGRVGDP